MELVIAVILGVILLIKVGSDKSASAEYDKRVDEKKERSKAFENKYTSQELETMLRGYISSEANYNSVCNEVCAELEGINYDYMWSGLLNDRQLYDVPKSQYKKMHEKMLNDREIALDVLLAKRGKIASIRTAFGYRAFLNSNDKELKKAFFEYAGRIMTLVNQMVFRRTWCTNMMERVLCMFGRVLREISSTVVLMRKENILIAD